MAEIVAIDFFATSGRAAAESAIDTLERRLRRGKEPEAARRHTRPKREDYRGRTWVTRKNIHVDRIAEQGRRGDLSAIAEIIHDIDVKDGKFGRAEAPGIAALVAGIALMERDDDARIQLGMRVCDALLALYRRKRG